MRRVIFQLHCERISLGFASISVNCEVLNGLREDENVSKTEGLVPIDSVEFEYPKKYNFDEFTGVVTWEPSKPRQPSLNNSR